MLLSVSLSVHTFLADLSTSSHVDVHHQKLAGELKQEAAELYNLWDLCHHHTSGQFTKVEAALQQLSQVLQVSDILLNTFSRSNLSSPPYEYC